MKPMEELEMLKEAIKSASDDKINEIISKGALRLEDEQVAVVSFVFWLVYMAETDLNDVVSNAWRNASSLFSQKIKDVATNMLQEMIRGNKELDPSNLVYFSDKIKVHEAMFGKNKLTNMLWKLNDIRNDLSHNRIENLSYDNQPLSLRTTKDKVLIDYFDSVLDKDLTKSKFWMSLSDEDKKDIEENFKKLNL